jgi:hypothetical protein
MSGGQSFAQAIQQAARKTAATSGLTYYEDSNDIFKNVP